MPGQTKEALTEHFATDDQPFHFVDSGLDNVYLVGIKYFTDPDGKGRGDSSGEAANARKGARPGRLEGESHTC